jgi:hypothetical protein
MATTPSIKVVKSIPFKGGTRHYTNRYHFAGGTPADGAHWTTLSDAIVTAEKAALNGTSTIVETIGYAAGSDVPVFTKVYSTAGTLATGTGSFAPSGVAALVRYATAGKTVKNHPIYLFNYYHQVLTSPGTGIDVLYAAQKSALNTYASSWISGFSDGTITATRTGPNGHPATGVVVEEYVTHRDFPYQTSV